ncbi:MAG: membrane-bound serine protease (ClpP class), partial [Halieaceae bacterium]
AEVTGRDPDIAEAMVDQDIAILGITETGKLLTFTVAEAIKNKYCEGEVNNLHELLVLTQLENHEIITYQPTSINKLIAWLINPAISGILIMLMLGGVYFELQSPGLGFPIAASFAAALLFFAPLYLQGIAENWEIILFFIGIIAVAVEVFLIPGTGIAGVLGIILIFTGLTLSMVENVQFDFSMVSYEGILTSLSVVLMATLVMAILTLILLPKMLDSRNMKRLVLSSEQKIEDGFVGVDNSNKLLIGQNGTTHTDLHPSGKVIINQQHFDATSLGAYIEKGTSIKVIAHEGAQIIVKQN